MRERLLAALNSPRFLWVVLAFALVIRVGFAFREPLMEGDAPRDRIIGRHLVEGRGYVAEDRWGNEPNTERAPVPPFLIAAIYWLGGTDRVVQIVWAILGTLVVWVTYRLVRDEHGAVPANLAALAMAVYPYNIIVGTMTETEIPNILLSFLMLDAALRWRRTGIMRHAFAVGAWGGLAILTRPATAAFGPVLAVAMLLRPQTVAISRRFRAVFVSALTATLLILPWCVRTSLVTGKPTLVTTLGPEILWSGTNPWAISYSEGQMSSQEFTAHFFAGIRPEMTRPERDKVYWDSLRSFFREQPGEVLRLLKYKTVRFWMPPGFTSVKTDNWSRSMRFLILLTGLCSYAPVALLAAWAVVRVRRWADWNRIAIYVVWIAVAFVTNIWFTAILRYRFAECVDAMMILLASLSMADWLSRQKTA
jgi:4-amino-4-deoxy-L-arabinose transferase-like glycosyltransferase